MGRLDAPPARGAAPRADSARLTPAQWREIETDWKEARLLASIQFEARSPGLAHDGEGYRPAPEADDIKRRLNRGRIEALRRAAREIHPFDSKRNHPSRIYNCGRVSQFGADVDTYYGRRKNGDVSLYGTQSCGRAWECAVCRSRLALAHAAEIGTALRRWHEAGYHALFVTLTIRHSYGDSLLAMREGMAAAWGNFTSGRQWLEWRRGNGAEYVLALDITHGDNGWHAHYHAIVFTKTELDADESRAWFHDRWVRFVSAKMGRPHVGTRANMVAVEAVERTSEGEEKVGRYISKMGFEMVADLNKTLPKPGGGRTPWAILESATETRDFARYAFAKGRDNAEAVSDLSKRETAIWCDYVAGLYRARWVRWSEGIREELDLGAPLDDSCADAVAAALDGPEPEGPPTIEARIPHELRKVLLFHRTANAAIQDALERRIPLGPLLGLWLTCTEQAIWDECNSRESLDEFAKTIQAKRLEKRAERDKRKREKAEEKAGDVDRSTSGK